ncbi:hypothetical protein FHS18_004097 [Paenibacillus phyllosphaerae]|uniref:Nucleotidyltransferase n=1 Tax=Paenibacillus phyllosphaerae TaxID=274593 RepID=A0A7W5FPG9_9BACL|nr:nucleotidyltransferase domain-containing protein [Paenibacillus phyllosphaerae]MBB3112019.1 hypothetical protein [Paenibacillus phyllosphaerae]
MNAMERHIQEELQRIEREEGVRIVYACESGSRAWGFPSKDSDYDVRFLYVRPVEWYLSIYERRDVIERPISDLLDFSGWDVRKALGLFRKSNPPLLEWLQSPTVYMEQYGFADQIRALSPLSFSPKSCMYHYLHMAKGNYRVYLQGEQVKIKKYFYVLRPILACAWIEANGTVPPIAFDELVEAMLSTEAALYGAVQELLARKKSGEELDLEPRLQVINDYLEDRIAYYEEAAKHQPAVEVDQDEQLDQLFRSAVATVWGTK